MCKERGLNRGVRNVVRLISKFFSLDKSSSTRGRSRKLKKVRFSTDLRHHFFQWKDNYVTEQPERKHCIGKYLELLQKKVAKVKDKDEFTFGHDVLWTPVAEPVTSGGLTGYSIHMVVSLTSSISMIIKFGLPLTVPTDMRQINTESNSMFNISLLFRRSLLNVTTHFRSKFNSSDCFRDCL